MEPENIQIDHFKIFTFKRKVILFVVLFSFFIVILFIGYFLSALSPVSQSSEIKQVEIKIGDGFSEISANLEAAGIVRSSTVFKIISLISGNAHKLKPGQYYLDTSLTSLEILNSLVAGPEVEKEVVIPEGFTFLDIDRRLSDMGIIKSKDLVNFNFDSVKSDYEFLKDLKSPIKNVEGYLFPDTYNFFINSTVEDVVRKFFDNFNIKAWPFLKDQTQLVGRKTFGQYQILTVASLIEKEVYYSEEMPIVAGIIYKRLKIGMPIQIDATIAYAKCGGFIYYCDNPIVTKKELSFVSPYNTYTNNTLPPTPISNPGINSINAALHPETSDYFYYLSDPETKKAIFSKTLEEHNSNRVKYLGL